MCSTYGFASSYDNSARYVYEKKGVRRWWATHVYVLDDVIYDRDVHPAIHDAIQIGDGTDSE